MTRKRTIGPSNHTILLVDDQEEYLAATRRVLEREGHGVVAVGGGRAALDAIARQPFDLVLVDYFMPTMTGEEVVRELRKTHPTLQVLLQTGYASERPPRELLETLDIQGYHDKSEGPERLCLWVDVALRAARASRQLERSRRGLAAILAATPALHRMQPIDDLLQGILFRMAVLLDAVDDPRATRPGERRLDRDSCLVLVVDGGHLEMRAATGRFASSDPARTGDVWSSLGSALGLRSVVVSGSGSALPLVVGDTAIGAIFVDRPVHDAVDQELLRVLANQAAVAIQSATASTTPAREPLPDRTSAWWPVRESA